MLTPYLKITLFPAYLMLSYLYHVIRHCYNCYLTLS
jgi:hypothetical protein